jgi:hypothetical protein
MKNITKNLILASFIFGLSFAAFPVFAGGMPSASTQSATNITATSADFNAYVTPNDNNINTFFKYGTNSGYLGSTITGPLMVMPGSVSVNISGLQSGTTYYFQACASAWNVQENCGSVLNFSTLGGTSQNVFPTVSTNQASSVGQSFATLNGYVTPNSSGANSWFEYGTSQGSLPYTVQSGYLGSPASINYAVSNLSANTTYYFRACASNSYGQNCGTTLSFSTQNGVQGNGVPSVTTQNATNIGQNSATLNGYVDSNNSYTTRWFQYGTSYNSLSNSTSSVSQGYGSYSVSESITGLLPNTVYYFRIAAQNQSGLSQGAVQSFSTPGNSIPDSSLPIAVTSPAAVVSQTMAKLNGTVVDQSLYSDTVWFEYGQSYALGSKSDVQNLGDVSSKGFSSLISNLSPNTAYYFQAVAQNQNGVSRGDILVFRTGSIPTPPSGGTHPGTGESSSKFLSLKIETGSDSVYAGDQVDYTASYKNISGSTIKDGVLRIALPKELVFSKSSDGVFSYSDNALIVKLGTLSSGDSGKITISGYVSESVKDKDVLITNAVLVYSNPISGVKDNIVAYATNNVAVRNLLPAASIFGSGSFLPNTLLEWLMLSVAIFALVYFGRKFYADIKAPKA